eukprot:2934205-Pyramimonas_sp.AAC.1
MPLGQQSVSTKPSTFNDEAHEFIPVGWEAPAVLPQARHELESLGLQGAWEPLKTDFEGLHCWCGLVVFSSVPLG